MPDDRKPSSDSETNQQDKPQRPEDDNPFIAFRRYADEQVSSIFNSILGLPLAEHWNDERIKEWKAWITEGKRPDGKQEAGAVSPRDQSPLLKMWSPDGREGQPQVVENEDGSKTYYWSKSWSWPPKDGNKLEETNDLDASQRKAVEEARRNAEKEMQELTNMVKSFFGPEEEKGTQTESKSANVLDWVWPTSNSEKDVEMRKEAESQGASPEKEHKSQRDKFWGRHRGSCRTREDDHSVTTALHGHHGFPPFGHFHGPRLGPHRFGDCRVRWLLSHPYSPVVLEAGNTKAGVQGPNFVDAFEDLMRVDEGLPIDERWAWERDMWPRRMRLMSHLHSMHPKTQEFWSNMHEGGDWFVPTRGLKPVVQGTTAKSLPLPDASSNAAAAQKSSEEHDQEYARFLGNSSPEPKTELDAYEQFLGGASSSSPAAKPQQQQVASKKFAPIDIEASPILSTVTTTERTVLPDGTVTTKVVFRKRFADGREESSETVNTTRGDPSPDHPAAENKSRGGWFWSK